MGRGIRAATQLAVVLSTAVLLLTNPAIGQAPFSRDLVDSASLTRQCQVQLVRWRNWLDAWNRAYTLTGQFLNADRVALNLLRFRAAISLHEVGESDKAALTDQQIRTEPVSVRIVTIDRSNWAAVGFIYRGGSWNGVRFTKAQRLNQNLESVVAPDIIPGLIVAPRHPQIAGVLLQYGYLFYETVGRPAFNRHEEIQFRFTMRSLDDFYTHKITLEDLWYASTIIIKSSGESLAQAIQRNNIGSAPATSGKCF